MRGGIDDNTTACRCLVLLLLSQRQLPSASVFDPKEGKDTELLLVVSRCAKEGRRELMVASALAFGETRRIKRTETRRGATQYFNKTHRTYKSYEMDC